MKIRNGFVSNSSSSSFCIYGAYVPLNSSLNNIFKLIKKIQEVKPEEYKKWMDNYSKSNVTREMYEFLLNISEKTKKEFMLLEGNKGEDEDEIAYEWQDNVINILESIGLYAYYVDYGLYIGRNYKNIGDSETGKQFRDSTQEVITKLFHKKCHHIEETIYD